MVIFFRRRCIMKTYMKSGLTLGALAVCSAGDDASGFGPIARGRKGSRLLWCRGESRPGRCDLAGAGHYRNRSSGNALDEHAAADYIPANSGRSFSYAPAPVVAQPAAPQTQNVRPAPQAADCPAPAASAPVRRYSYSYQPRTIYRGWTKRIACCRYRPANRDAAAKAQGEY